MFHKILTPIDSSEIAPSILPYVVYLAKGLSIPVELTTILVRDQLDALERESKGSKEDGEYHPEDLLKISVSEDSGAQVTYQGVVKKNGEDYSPFVIKNSVLPAGRYLGQMMTRFNDQGLETRGVVRVGEAPSEEILRLADQDGCDVIAIATHDRNLLLQAIQGSVTNEITRAGQVPVLAVSPRKDEMASAHGVTLTSILVPLDGSPLAESVLPYVESLAQTLSLQVFLVNVVQEQYAFVGMTSGDPVHPHLIEAELDAQQAREQVAQQYLQRIADGLAGKGISVQWEVLRGATEPSLEGLSGQLSDNMIALASHGRSGLGRWVMGSVAEDLIRKTGDPVLVIPSGVAEEES